MKTFIKLVRHIDIVYAMTRESKAILLEQCPLMLNGALTSWYLCRAAGRTRAGRKHAFLFHYAWLGERVGGTFFKTIFRSKYQLWRHDRTDGDGYSIALTVDPEVRYEGELSLILERNGFKLFELCFSVVPGNLVGSEDEHTMLVARVQGVAHRLDEIRLATKACNDIAPPYLLVAAVKAVATALDIGVITGVGNLEQLSKSPGSSVAFDYDAFWRSVSATEMRRGFFALPSSFSGKPIEAVNPVHRRRARAKQRFKNETAERVKLAFTKQCLA